MNTSVKTYLIYASLWDDKSEGNAWLKNCLPRRCVIRVENHINKKVIYCVGLLIENNFLKRYNSSELTKKIDIDACRSKGEPIVMNAWYRSKLGVSSGDKVALKINTKPSFFPSVVGIYWRVKACLDHPELSNRVTYKETAGRNGVS